MQRLNLRAGAVIGMAIAALVVAGELSADCRRAGQDRTSGTLMLWR